MDLTEQELIKKNIQLNRFKILMDVILILVLVGIAYYIFSEIEAFKILGQDVCQLCMDKTGVYGKVASTENIIINNPLY